MEDILAADIGGTFVDVVHYNRRRGALEFHKGFTTPQNLIAGVESTIEKVKGMRPYTPLELAGRDIYIREGCYSCHSQMIRTLRDEVERYGHYSLAAESMYDHPFQWGSKRTGPDLARVGGKYFNE